MLTLDNVISSLARYRRDAGVAQGIHTRINRNPYRDVEGLE